MTPSPRLSTAIAPQKGWSLEAVNELANLQLAHFLPFLHSFI